MVFTIEVAYTGIFGILGLIRYRRRIANFYADIEERALPALMTLLILFVVTALISISANLIGTEFFRGKILLVLPSLLLLNLPDTASK